MDRSTPVVRADAGKRRRGTRQRRIEHALVARGFAAMLPLWTGAVPVGVAYAVAAHDAGLNAFETQLMSLVVFSAATQLGAVALLAAGAPALTLVGAALALNVQALLLGLAVSRQSRLSWGQRLLTAFVLTDGAYGISAARGRLRAPVLLGAGVSMFLAWNAGTALGVALGQALPDARGLGLDLVAPLTFLAVLTPLVRTRTALLVALAAGTTALLLAQFAPSGVVVLGAGLAGSAVGAWRTRESRGAAGEASRRSAVGIE